MLLSEGTTSMRLVLVIALAACRPAPFRVPTTPIPIAIIAPIPGGVKPTCWLDTPPKAPELRDLDLSAEILERVMIHRRDYLEMIAFAHDLELWAGQMRDCLAKVVDQ